MEKTMTLTAVKKLIDTSVIYDDGSKSERYTNTGDINTANFKAVPYEYDGLAGKVKRYFLVYKRCADGKFGNYLKGIRVKNASLKDCVNEINNYLEIN